MCNIPASGEWVTCTYDLSGSDYSSVNLSNVRSFLLQTFTDGYSGVVQFDDFKAGTSVINDFDTQYDVFSIANNMKGGDAITEIKTVYLDGNTDPIIKRPDINLSAIDFSKAKVYDISGKRVFANNPSELKNGVYIVRVNGMSKKFVVKNR